MRRARACSGSGEQTSSPEGLDKRLVEVVVTATIVGVATRGGRVDYRPSVCCGRECRVRGLGDVKARSHAGGHAMRGRWARGWYRSGCANDDAGCGRESRLGREGAPAGQGRIKAHQEDAAAYGLARIGHHDRFNLNNNTTKPGPPRACAYACSWATPCAPKFMQSLVQLLWRYASSRGHSTETLPRCAARRCRTLSLRRCRLRPCKRVTSPLTIPSQPTSRAG
jgi:hypothetical protein